MKYEAQCRTCGRKGFVIEASDDWGRSETTWEGFDNEPPDPTAVGRKRVDARDLTPVCQCGSKSVARGAYIGECDWKGELLPK